MGATVNMSLSLFTIKYGHFISVSKKQIGQIGQILLLHFHKRKNWFDFNFHNCFCVAKNCSFALKAFTNPEQLPYNSTTKVH